MIIPRANHYTSDASPIGDWLAPWLTLMVSALSSRTMDLLKNILQSIWSLRRQSHEKPENARNLSMKAQPKRWLVLEILHQVSFPGLYFVTYVPPSILNSWHR